MAVRNVSSALVCTKGLAAAAGFDELQLDQLRGAGMQVRTVCHARLACRRICSAKCRMDPDTSLEHESCPELTKKETRALWLLGSCLLKLL
jgi:hypothetical protein